MKNLIDQTLPAGDDVSFNLIEEANDAMSEIRFSFEDSEQYSVEELQDAIDTLECDGDGTVTPMHIGFLTSAITLTMRKRNLSKS